jgi:DNA-binding response OmpR family regulator
VAHCYRIVVTDDDPKLLTRVVGVLRGAGHMVFAAYDGVAAVELALVITKLDLLITNTRLADLDAPQLIARVRASRPTLPILHIGDLLPDSEHMRDVPTLQEPFTGSELLEAVDRVLRGRRDVS